jgi:hypothetical protein
LANVQVEQQKQKQFLLELLQEDVRNQLPKDTQVNIIEFDRLIQYFLFKDFDQWLSSYRQIFTSSIESNKVNSSVV